MLSQQSGIDDKLLDCSSILDDRYKIIETIGEGRQAKQVFESKGKIGNRYGKYENHCDQNNAKLLDEHSKKISILSEMNQENLIQITYASLNGEYKKYNGKVHHVIYYVMKIADFGELYKFLEHTPIFQEKYARFYFKQLLDGLEYLQSRGIAHLDIKPENLLIGKNSYLKLVDFGFSCKTIDKSNQRIKINSNIPVGSPGYNTPEQMHKETYYADDADLFAAGCVLFQMVINSSPFTNTQNQDPYYQRLCSNSPSYWKIFENIANPSAEFKNLIENMLQKDPNKRFTINQIKMHPWFQGEIPSLSEIKNEMSLRFEAIYNIYNEKMREKRQKKIKKYENFQKPETLSKEDDPFEQIIFELKQKYQNQVKSINNIIQKNYKKRKIQKQRKKKSSQSSQGSFLDRRGDENRAVTPKSSDSDVTEE